MDETKLHIVAVTGMVVENGRVLIIKRSEKEVVFPNKWTIPGGKAEKGEGILETLKKEIKEEIGLEIKDNINFLNEYNFIRSDGYSVVGLCFVCQYKSGEVVLEKGLNGYRWVSKNDYQKYDLIDGVSNDLKKFFVDK